MYNVGDIVKVTDYCIAQDQEAKIVEIDESRVRLRFIDKNFYRRFNSVYWFMKRQVELLVPKKPDWRI